jgi:DDB1- and CUL4-associated factor 15
MGQFTLQRNGYFNSGDLKSHEKIPYKEVPSSLAFCLKDIVPVCYLENHIFMGLTSCGQFLISYKRYYENEETINYDFSSGYKYELFFWIYSPGKLLSKYYNGEF